MLQRIELKINQTKAFSSDTTFDHKITASLYQEGRYVAKGHLDYRVKSGKIKKGYLVISRAAGGWCSDDDILRPDVVRSVTWKFEKPPFAEVNGVAANIVGCFYGTTRNNWIRTIKNSGITHVRVTVSTESQYIETLYRIPQGE
jgi:hypothetical protein